MESEVKTTEQAPAESEVTKVETPKEEPKAPEAPKETPKEPAIEQEKVSPKEEKVAPEKYDFKIPEGSLLSKERVESISAYAKQNGLTQEQAQDLLQREHDAAVDVVKNQQQAFDEMKVKWVDEIKNDKELGGDNFEKSIEMARRVIHKFGSDGLKQQLDQTGLGNHPDLVRFVSRIGKAMSEDQLVIAGSKTKAPVVDIADKLYPTTKGK